MMRNKTSAKKMLLGKEGNVRQVAEWLGYSNAQYFSKLFQKMTGTAPELPNQLGKVPV